MLCRLQEEVKRYNGCNVAEDRDTRGEDRQGKLRLRLWVVAEKGGEGRR